MAEKLPVRSVEVSFVGPPPMRRLARSSGVSELAMEGSTVRCLVCGSFQPFLDALQGHEVIDLDSTPIRPDGPPTRKGGE